MKRTSALLLLLVAANTQGAQPPKPAQPASAPQAQRELICDVKICQRIHRWSLNPLAHLKDKIGEECYNTRLPQSLAVVGKELNSTHVWSINPTKKSITKIKEVGVCQ